MAGAAGGRLPRARRRPRAAAGCPRAGPALAAFVDDGSRAARRTGGRAAAPPDCSTCRPITLRRRSRHLRPRAASSTCCPRARTIVGEATLAAWLLAPATPDVARARQQATSDLAAPRRIARGPRGARSRHAARGRHRGAGGWAARRRRSPPPAGARWCWGCCRRPRWPASRLWIASAEPTAGWIAGALAAQALIGLWRSAAACVASIREVEPRARDLALAAALIERIEPEPFAAPALTRLQQPARRRAALPASTEIRAALAPGRAAHVAAEPAVRRRCRCCSSGPRSWHGPSTAGGIRAGPRVPGWIAALGDVEAMAALGTYAAEHPEAVFPAFVDGAPRAAGDAGSHIRCCRPTAPSATTSRLAATLRTS